MSETPATVFGLDVWSEEPLSLLRGAVAEATGRRLDVRRCACDPASLRGPFEFALVSDQAQADGTVSFRIEAHPEAGYLLWGPRYGAHLLSSDGCRLSCAPGAVGEDAWQRLLVAQVLPFAAVLRGLEVLHASAVVIDGRAVALLGPSGSGKTSVALELCRRGASFLADDVLALELDAMEPLELIAHPGSPVVGLDHGEARRVQGMWTAAEVLGSNERELLMGMPGAGEPAPLAALFLLDRRADGPPQPRFEPLVGAGVLLTATFNFVVATPERLRGLLDVCALAARRRVERVVVGPSVDAECVGELVWRRMGASR